MLQTSGYSIEMGWTVDGQFHLLVEHTDSEAKAWSIWKEFQSKHVLDPRGDAQGGLFRHIGFQRETLASWVSGIKFGPVDTRHPLERIFAAAIRSGQPVSIIDEGRVTRFNQVAA